MGAHQLFSVLIVVAGAATAFLGIAIATMGVLVRQRVSASRRTRPSFDI